mmetsp:Transcript_30352/g.86849  ORF Transcript_30352/g.86849 Transcript_30352/m.86849 type:complete len:354 (+) Transcript_30352:1165-2226(+)
MRIVMREGQHPPLVEGVGQVPRQLLATEDLQLGTGRWILAKIRQCVEGESHVPLKVEAEVFNLDAESVAARLGGPLGDPLEIGRLFGCQQHTRMPPPNPRAQLAKKRHAVGVDRAAPREDCVAVFLLAEVAVDHGSDGVEPQPVHVEMRDPMLRRAAQVGPHLWLRVVEASRAPARQLAQGSFVLKLRRAAVARQTPGVARKVRQDKVDEDSDAMPVQCVHQVAKVVGRAEPAVHRVEARGALVAPRLVRRVLRQRQQLHSDDTELEGVLRQRLRHGSVAQGLAILPSHPTAQVHLVNAQRLLRPSLRCPHDGAPRQPRGVGPGEATAPSRAIEVAAVWHLGVVAPVHRVDEL